MKSCQLHLAGCEHQLYEPVHESFCGTKILKNNNNNNAFEQIIMLLELTKIDSKLFPEFLSDDFFSDCI